MAEGISTYLANKLLDHVCRGVAYTPPTTVYFQAHVAAPGAAMTANVASNTARVAVPFSAASGGAINISGTPEHTLGGANTITHGSFWDAASGGNPLWSAAASVAKGGVAGDIIRVSSAPLSLGPLAS
ncbi:head protein [Mycobacterium phage Quesadilla]|uniref:Uncharacterized protein n=1 Tax=Mycobacterium phage Quesadilla TaxID=2664226 RepID=A0A5Q2WF11_9CAUD|nr:head protein [Mycobacterium phage Quesadilla]QGH75283.1 hypothetical protein SEA_QUESADILLA_35 [Mycobacterium phage Quesadilla]